MGKGEVRQPTLEQYYRDVVSAQLRDSGGYDNVHKIPALQKIVVNSAIDSAAEKNWADEVAKDIALITGQRPVIVRARKNISNFKLRAGMPNGVKVTLRARNMYEFFYRLVSVVLPRLRDFRGLSSRCDGRGNYTLGVADHTVFPEISAADRERTVGMNITIVTSARTDSEALELLRRLGMPFQRREVGGTAAA
ncbi:MAG: 50S ribosomal protein L5 [Puniceicoccales bacterium]|jgi:large subunit ribosomal protein L5|nr:50S ribosomal protein L5 [Puniceicoccales bacterium]